MTTTLSPSLGHGVLMTQAGVGTTPGYDAIDVRRMALAPNAEGVQSYESFRVRQRGAGANMSVDIGMDLEAYVRGDAVALQSIYTVAPHSATVNEVIGTADVSNPRIDQIVVEAKDNTHDASGSNLAQTRVVAGTPTSGATLDNRTGAAALPSSALLLADVLVGTGVATIVDANIRDRRAFVPGTIPPLLTRIDQIAVTSPLPTVIKSSASLFNDLEQVAALVWVPRRIVSATRLRWWYRQDNSTALTGNYNIGLFDASGRTIVSTGSVAFTGATASVQARSETITATTFEAGMYYALFGVDTTNSGTINYAGWGRLDLTGVASLAAPASVNQLLRIASGGVTMPTTILGLTDVTTLAATTVNPVPQFALSVG